MKRFALRLPDELHAWLSTYSESQGRSINEQILWLLRRERVRAGKRVDQPEPEGDPT